MKEGRMKGEEVMERLEEGGRIKVRYSTIL